MDSRYTPGGKPPSPSAVAPGFRPLHSQTTPVSSSTNSGILPPHAPFRTQFQTSLFHPSQQPPRFFTQTFQPAHHFAPYHLNQGQIFHQQPSSFQHIAQNSSITAHYPSALALDPKEPSKVIVSSVPQRRLALPINKANDSPVVTEDLAGQRILAEQEPSIIFDMREQKTPQVNLEKKDAEKSAVQLSGMKRNRKSGSKTNTPQIKKSKASTRKPVVVFEGNEELVKWQKWAFECMESENTRTEEKACGGSDTDSAEFYPVDPLSKEDEETNLRIIVQRLWESSRALSDTKKPTESRFEFSLNLLYDILFPAHKLEPSEESVITCDTNFETIESDEMRVQVPLEMLDKSVFKQVVSMDTWTNVLNDRDREELMRYLPSNFSSHDQKSSLIEDLLGGQNFHFGNPIDLIHHQILQGRYHPELKHLQESLWKKNDIKFHEHTIPQKIESTLHNSARWLSMAEESLQTPPSHKLPPPPSKPPSLQT